MKIFFRIIYPVICIGIGWIIGSKHQAPPIVIETTDQLILATSEKIGEALKAREQFMKDNLAVANLVEAPGKSKTSPSNTKALSDIKDHIDTAPVIEIVSAPGTVKAAPIAKDEVILPSNGLAPFIKLCKIPKISNAPKVNSHGHVTPYKQLTDVEGVTMAMMPVKDACISSGFGPRKGKRHKGVDYYSKSGGSIFAAGNGQIIEAEYRNDYGFTVLINHGNGYYTRYAHLAGFNKGVVIGAAVPRGFELGEMGQTAAYKIPKHLHFELLKGDYNNPKKSFGLKPVDILTF